MSLVLCTLTMAISLAPAISANSSTWPLDPLVAYGYDLASATGDVSDGLAGEIVAVDVEDDDQRRRPVTASREGSEAIRYSGVAANGAAPRFIGNSAGDILDTTRVTIPEGKFGYLLKNPSNPASSRTPWASTRRAWTPLSEAT